MSINHSINKVFLTTAKYLLALALLAGLSYSVFVLMSVTLGNYRYNSQAISTSARQSTLSQSLYLCAKESTEQRVGIAHKYTLTYCRQNMKAFKTQQAELAEFVNRIQLSPETSALKDLYSSSGPMSKRWTRYLSKLNQTLESGDIGDMPSQKDRIELSNFLEQSTILLQINGEATLNHLIWTEGFIFMAILLCLLGMCFLLFRPHLLDLRNHQRELLEAQIKAEEKGRRKNDFFASMSHEIRTPINGISGMIELLKMTDLDNEQSEFINAMNTSTQTLLLLINDILDFSKLESDKLSLESAPLCIDEMFDNLFDILYQSAQKRGFEFMMRMSPDIPQHLLGDQNRLQQILLNLLSNAFKFTESGHVLLDVSVISSGNSETSIRFSVTDTGKGISAEKLNVIFDQYTQEEDSTTRNYGGSGLGLAICKRLINQMGGQIFVDSALNKGSEFWFDVPFKHSEPLAQLEQADEGTDVEKSVKILVVDDYEPSRKNLFEQIVSQGYSVEIVSSFHEAMVALNQSHDDFMPFDMVLTDFQMPEQTGEDLARAIKSDPKLFHIPIVLMANHHYPKSQTEMQQDGFQGMLYKPLSPTVISRLLLMLSTSKQYNFKPNIFYTNAFLRKDIDELTSVFIDNKCLLEARSEARDDNTVLVVEDTPINQKVIRGLLSKLGVQAEVVSSGEEALEKIEKHSYQLILMDLHMPGLNGLETTEKIREKYPIDMVPIIALTADVDVHVRTDCDRVGMNGFLEKPIALDKLQDCLTRWCIEFSTFVHHQ
jgi:signal transduction histidine kinase/DNA-binding response OmpR family regulator